jgi:hypothetical protein
MLAGLDSRNCVTPIRQILAVIAAHAIGAPIARVLTQPESEAAIQTERLLPAGQTAGSTSKLPGPVASVP